LHGKGQLTKLNRSALIKCDKCKPDGYIFWVGWYRTASIKKLKAPLKIISVVVKVRDAIRWYNMHNTFNLFLNTFYNNP
jgi:hypothetical protein